MPPTFPQALLALAGFAPAVAPQVTGQLVPVPAERVSVDSPFWAPRIAANRARTLPALLARLEDEGYLANFDLVAEKAKEGHRGGPDADAQVYRAIRAVALELQGGADAALRARVAAWIPRIAAAQQDDGYLHTFVSVARPGARFAELATSRELECLGALIEAGLAWERATADATLLDVAVRAAGRLERAVYDESLPDPPGRPGVERALALLFQRTGREDWLWLGDDLLLRRGKSEDRRPWGPELQDAVPARKLFTASGDALGLLGLQRGMIEVYAATGDPDLLAAVLNVWKDLTQAKTYVTGGAGVEPRGLLPAAHELPHALARCEPAVSVELVQAARRLLQLTRQAAFADFEERVLYNALAAASAPDGTGFLAACPLAAPGGLARAEWLDDPRSITALAGFYPELALGAVLHAEDDVYVAHYLGGEANLLLPGGAVRVVQKTEYPWSGRIEIRVVPEKPMELTIHARVPAWAGDTLRAGVDDAVADLTIDRGDQHGMWLAWERIWTGRETLVIELAMTPRRIAADPRVDAQAGRVALGRGPLVYALEGADNDGRAQSLALPADAELEETWEPGLAGGGALLRANGRASFPRGREPQPSEGREPPAAEGTPARLTAIPYALIANRGPSDLAVWIPRSASDAATPGETRVRVGDVLVRASHCHRLDSLAALLDGEHPTRSDDPDAARMTFRPRTGSKEWIEIELPAERVISGVRVFWVDDGVEAEGRCATPRSWRMLRRAGPAGDGWTPLAPAEGEHYWTSTDRLRDVPLEGPFTTRALRMELELRPGRSAGLFELEIVSP